MRRFTFILCLLAMPALAQPAPETNPEFSRHALDACVEQRNQAMNSALVAQGQLRQQVEQLQSALKSQQAATKKAEDQLRALEEKAKPPEAQK